SRPPPRLEQFGRPRLRPLLRLFLPLCLLPGPAPPHLAATNSPVGRHSNRPRPRALHRTKTPTLLSSFVFGPDPRPAWLPLCGVHPHPCNSYETLISNICTMFP